MTPRDSRADIISAKNKVLLTDLRLGSSPKNSLTSLHARIFAQRCIFKEITDSEDLKLFQLTSFAGHAAEPGAGKSVLRPTPSSGHGCLHRKYANVH